MNPDQLIMTLGSNADVEIEANVETGKGYVSAEVAEDENKIIGEIKLINVLLQKLHIKLKIAE